MLQVKHVLPTHTWLTFISLVSATAWCYVSNASDPRQPRSDARRLSAWGAFPRGQEGRGPSTGSVSALFFFYYLVVIFFCVFIYLRGLFFSKGLLCLHPSLFCCFASFTEGKINIWLTIPVRPEWHVSQILPYFFFPTNRSSSFSFTGTLFPYREPTSVWMFSAFWVFFFVFSQQMNLPVTGFLWSLKQF